MFFPKVTLVKKNHTSYHILKCEIVLQYTMLDKPSMNKVAE